MQALKSLSESSSEVISLVTAAGRVIYASASSFDAFGYRPEEMVGLDSLDLIHPEDRDHSRRALGAVVARPPGPRHVRVRVRRKNGEFSRVESTISNFLDEPRIGAIVVSYRVNYREIGAGKAARKNNRRQSEELVRSNARLEDFAYAVAHDLREPLRTISMFTELLIEEADLDARGKMQAQFIVDGVARMSALFEGLHTFAVRGFDDPPQPFDLGFAVAEVLHNLGHAIKTSGATVTVDPLPIVLGNEKHLVRVFQNLIVNAIKYRSDAPVEIHVTAERLGSEWIIKVRDNGIGIAPEHQDRVFGLFKRLHGPETPGAGIGLAICRKIVDAMGGAIWVEPAPGQGSIFCFTIAETPVPALPIAAGNGAGESSAIPGRIPARSSDASPANVFAQYAGVRQTAGTK
jgi:PAS domain S-box-containing protein